MVERIVRMRKNNAYPFSQSPSELGYSFSPQKRVSQSVLLLPPIEELHPSV
jgi:hypothetical protein